MPKDVKGTGEAEPGALVKRNDLTPTSDGPIIYINCFGRLGPVVGRVAAAGGRVLVPELNPGTFGFRAIVIDSEGNNIGLISNEA